MLALPRAGDVSPGHYAVLGDGRTAALLAPDGAVDWLCLPDLDATPVLARLLDADRGGHFSLAPEEGAAERRYLPGTNAVETTWACGDGQAVVTDALVAGPTDEPLLVRRIDGRSGRVRMAWEIAVRFGDGTTLPTSADHLEHGLRVHGAGPSVTVGAPGINWDGASARGAFEVAAGDRLLISLTSAPDAPAFDATMAALDDAMAGWRGWSSSLRHEGRWHAAVIRSALALRLLVRKSTGAVAAAATLGLPEQPGGSRNFDYRYCWLRDSSFVVDAFARLGDLATAEAYLRWLSGAIAQTLPELQPYYRLDGGTRAPQREADLAGYRGATPVLIGNHAFQQRQLGSAGDVLQSCAVFVDAGGSLPGGLSEQLATVADHVARSWREDDAGIWETDPPRQHTWSKMACWVALDRAANLADGGHLTGDASAWRSAAEQIRDHVEAHHYDGSAYVAVAGEDGLDAAVLLGVFMDYPPRDAQRWHSTLERIDAELGCGPLLYRTSELREQEQTFLPCAFWRAHALARLGRLDEAAEQLDALIALGNDVGLFSEEAAPDGTAWGNLPQALTHAALVNAAVTYEERRNST